MESRGQEDSMTDCIPPRELDVLLKGEK